MISNFNFHKKSIKDIRKSTELLTTSVSLIIVELYAEAELCTAGPAAARLVVLFTAKVLTCHAAGRFGAAAFGDLEQRA